jgi:hypothetical protein
VHGGKIDMAAIGRKGGKSKETALRKEVRVDDELREQAREVLAKALRGEEVDREQLAAAKSLFSYRPNASPLGEQGRVHEGGAKVVSLVDLVRVAVEAGMVTAERGGAILVDGHRVQREDPTLSRSQREAAEPPALGPETPEHALAQLVDDEAPKFSETEEAKLARRYGSDEGHYSWP